jgi:ATP-dependent exoDNAse (exonuclease V) alpha subunit
VRDAKGLPKGSVTEGEPLLVLRNNYDLNRFNGETLGFESWLRIPAKQWEVYHRYKDDVQRSSFGLARVEGDEVALAMGAVSGRMDTDWVGSCQGVSKEVFGEKVPYLHCNYGYTMTGHKVQGSEYDHTVVVIEPSVRINTKDGRRWAYTALTRAKKSVKIAWNVKVA